MSVFLKVRSVLLKDGRLVKKLVEIYEGACLVGDPTAFIQLEGRIVWVVPGQSVDFVEA